MFRHTQINVCCNCGFIKNERSYILVRHWTICLSFLQSQLKILWSPISRSWAAMKRYAQSINSLFIITWPTQSCDIKWSWYPKPFINVVKVRRVLSNSLLNLSVVLRFGNIDSWCQRILSFLLNCQLFSYFVANLPPN